MTATADQGETACQWCRAQRPPGDRTCATCGAPLDRAEPVPTSGWRERPAAGDLAEVGFGHGSTCRVAGTVAPVVDLTLGAGDGVYFEPHALLWSIDAEVQPLPVKDALDRRFAGMPYALAAARGPGHVACSRSTPGELVVLPLPPGTAVEAREHSFVLASATVRYSYNFFAGATDQSGSAYLGDASGTWLDRFVTKDSEGLLLLHGNGNVFERTLGGAEAIDIRPGGFLYKDVTVTAETVSQVVKPGLVKKRTSLMRLTGPGRVGLQSMYVDPEAAAARS